MQGPEGTSGVQVQHWPCSASDCGRVAVRQMEAALPGQCWSLVESLCPPCHMLVVGHNLAQS